MANCLLACVDSCQSTCTGSASNDGCWWYVKCYVCVS